VNKNKYLHYFIFRQIIKKATIPVLKVVHLTAHIFLKNSTKTKIEIPYINGSNFFEPLITTGIAYNKG